MLHEGLRYAAPVGRAHLLDQQVPASGRGPQAWRGPGAMRVRHAAIGQLEERRARFSG